MKKSENGLHYRALRPDQTVEVTNVKEGVTARFLVDYVHLFGFIPVRALFEISIGAAMSGDWYFLRELRGKDVRWTVVQ